MNKRLGRLAAVLALGISFAASGHAIAAQTASPKRISGISISPAFQDITLNPEKQSETFTFSVTNRTGEPYEFALSVVDFGSLDESGGVLFIGESGKQLNYRYGLSAWAALERDRITVEPNATAKVPVTVTNKESMSPGGHYGAILLSPVQSGDRPSKVQVNQVLSSLLFVKKQGGEIYDFGLKSFNYNRNLFRAPSQVDFRFQNSGNVHVIPRGTVTVTDPRGRQVQKGIINADSAIILPESFRRITAKLNPMSSVWMPGTYRGTIAYRFDGEEKTQFREISFVYIPVSFVVAAFLLAAGVILIVVNKTMRKAAIRVVKAPPRVLKRLKKPKK